MDSSLLDIDFGDIAQPQIKTGQYHCSVSTNQVELDKEIFVKIPLGFRKKGKVVNLKKFFSILEIPHAKDE